MFGFYLPSSFIASLVQAIAPLLASKLEYMGHSREYANQSFTMALTNLEDFSGVRSKGEFSSTM